MAEGGLPSWYTILGSILTKDPMFPMKAQAQYESLLEASRVRKERAEISELSKKPIRDFIETGRMEQTNQPGVAGFLPGQDQDVNYGVPEMPVETKWNQYDQPRVKFEEATLGTLPAFKAIQSLVQKEGPEILHGSPGTQFLKVEPGGKITPLWTVEKEAQPEKNKLLSPTDLQGHYDVDPNVAAEASRLWNKGDTEGYQQLMLNVKPKAKEKAEKEYVPQAFETPTGEITWIRPGDKIPKGFKPYRPPLQVTPVQEENKAEKDRRQAQEVLFGDPKNVLARGLVRQDYQSTPLTDAEKKKALNKYGSMKRLWSENVKALVDEVLADAGVLTPKETGPQKDQYGFVIGETKRAKDGKKYRYMGENKWEKLAK